METKEIFPNFTGRFRDWIRMVGTAEAPGAAEGIMKFIIETEKPFANVLVSRIETASASRSFPIERFFDELFLKRTAIDFLDFLLNDPEEKIINQSPMNSR
jgi:hypothetical protein